MRVDLKSYPIAQNHEIPLFSSYLEFNNGMKKILVKELRTNYNNIDILINDIEHSVNPSNLFYIANKRAMDERVKLFSEYALEDINLLTSVLEIFQKILPSIFKRYINSNGRVSNLVNIVSKELIFDDGSHIPIKKVVGLTLDTMLDSTNVTLGKKITPRREGMFLDAAAYWSIMCLYEIKKRGDKNHSRINFISGPMLAKYLFDLPQAPQTRDWYDKVFGIAKTTSKIMPQRIICNIVPLNEYRKVVSLSSTHPTNRFVNAYGKYHETIKSLEAIRRKESKRIKQDINLEQYNLLEDIDNEQLIIILNRLNILDKFTFDNLNRIRTRFKNNPALYNYKDFNKKVIESIFAVYFDSGHFDGLIQARESAREVMRESRLKMEGLPHFTAQTQFDLYLGKRTNCPQEIEAMNSIKLKKMLEGRVK